MLGNDPLDVQAGKVPSGRQEIPIWEVALPLLADSGWMTSTRKLRRMDVVEAKRKRALRGRNHAEG
jgi:hypothetical protein